MRFPRQSLFSVLPLTLISSHALYFNLVPKNVSIVVLVGVHVFSELFQLVVAPHSRFAQVVLNFNINLTFNHLFHFVSFLFFILFELCLFFGFFLLFQICFSTHLQDFIALTFTCLHRSVWKVFSYDIPVNCVRLLLFQFNKPIDLLLRPLPRFLDILYLLLLNLFLLSFFILITLIIVVVLFCELLRDALVFVLQRLNAPRAPHLFLNNSPVNV